MIKIGIIGGSGLDDPKLLKNSRSRSITTRYGKPSSTITTGKVKDVSVAILARHGRDHSIWPTGVNFRANISALKKLKCTHILATTAVGSLRAQIRPGNLVFPDQFIDFTKHRILTFFDRKEVIHISMAEPFCPILRELLYKNARRLKFPCHRKGTVVSIEGPRFSTKAESHMFRKLGADIINMSTIPEVVLAREAKICYASIAMSTDYDCWKEDEDPVTWEMIKNRMEENAEKVKRLLLEVIPRIEEGDCMCKK